MDLLLYGLAAGLVWYFTEAKKFLDNYQVKVKRFSLDNSASAKTLYLKLIGKITLQINNPSHFMATLDKLQLTAWYNGKVVGSVYKNSPITLQAGNIDYDFDLDIITLSLFTSVANAIEAIKAGKQLELQIKGFAIVGKSTLPINQTVKFL